MKKEYLIIVALTIFISFSILVSIKQSQNANYQAYENESKINDLESQIQDLEYNQK